MDIAAFTTAFTLAKQGLDILRGVKDIMPESENKNHAAQLLEQANHSFRIAEAKATDELGYMLCHCTWPPQICLRISKEVYRCPKCGADPYQ